MQRPTFLKPSLSIFKFALKALFSPTYAVARVLKHLTARRIRRTPSVKKFLRYRSAKANLMEWMDTGYLILSLILCMSFLVVDFFIGESPIRNWNRSLGYWPMLIASYLYFQSRNNEILLAFVSDAVDKVRIPHGSSALRPSQRVAMALRSYGEAIINAAAVFYFMPRDWFGSNPENQIKDFAEALYYSAVTVTAVGYGSISPQHFIAQWLSVLEVFTGFGLLFVAFTIYTSLEENPMKPFNSESQKSS